MFSTAGLFATPQTINLVLGALPTILDAGGDLTITGPGATKLTVNAGGNSGVLDSFAKHLTLTGFTVANGKRRSGRRRRAGGLDGAVVLDGMQFTGNTATGGGFNNGSGGAIGMGRAASLTVRNSTISGNTAEKNGGGIYFYSGGSLLVVRQHHFREFDRHRHRPQPGRRGHLLLRTGGTV